MRRTSLLVCLALIAGCGSEPAGVPDASLLHTSAAPLGYLPLPIPEAVWSAAFGVSDNGWVAGEIDVTPAEWHAARWKITRDINGVAVATLEDLGTLNGRITAAFDVNEHGVVVGGSEEYSFGFGPGPDEAFVYRNGVMEVLPTLGGTHAFARRINNSGWIAGFSDTPSGESHPTVWRPNIDGSYTPIDLGTLGGTYGWANTIDEAGRVVGLSETASGSVIAWTWDGLSPIRPLPPVSPNGLNYAVDFNARGVILGNGTTEVGDYHAAKWQNRQVQDLHSRFPGYEISFGTGINARNEMVVTADVWAFNPAAWLLIGDNATDLTPLTGNPNSEVYDINERGWIAGGSGDAASFYSAAGIWLPGGPAPAAAVTRAPASQATRVNALSVIARRRGLVTGSP